MREGPLSRRSLLVVEDETFTRVIVLTILRDLGAERTLAAEDGREAMDLLAGKAKDVDAVICDFKMPEMNGLELLRSIRSGRTAARREMPFAMLTGNSDRALVGAAVSLDVNAFLVKPVGKRALSERLTRILTERRALKSAAIYDRVEIELAEVPAAAPPRAEDIDVQEHHGVDDLPPDAVLARDIVLHGCRIMTAGSVLGLTEIQRLRGFADLADLVGPLPPIYVRRPPRDAPGRAAAGNSSPSSSPS